MALNPFQQAFEKIKTSRHILIVLPQNINADNLGAALALFTFFKEQNKSPELLSPEPPPEKYAFLPDFEKARQKVEILRDFVISINTEKNKVSRVRYEQESNSLKIFLSSRGQIEEKNICLEPGAFKYDLIVTLGATDLESLGCLFEKYNELFFGKPILNIDDQAANEHYGEINLVEPTASSCSEIVLDLLEKQGVVITQEKIATLLLAGIIEKTDSFQNHKTSPKALTTASFLINAGADREKIVTSLYKTKSVSFLKFWGRVLAKINFNEEKGLVFCRINQEDFEETKTSSQELFLIMSEIRETFPKVNAAYLLWQSKEEKIKGVFFSPKTSLSRKIEELFPSSHQEPYLVFSDEASKEFQSTEDKLNSLLESML